jgi:GTP-binding protein EngB required for normal cell division
MVAMDPQQNLPQVPDYAKFRVLIIGRANTGKTSILQRVCDTMENPEIHTSVKMSVAYMARYMEHDS